MNGDKKEPLKSGEKGFAFILLAVGAFMAYQSALLYIANPDWAGPALMPAIASAAVIVADAFVITSNMGRKARQGAGLLTTDALASIIAIVAYCVFLKLGAPFFIVTPAFVWGLTTHLRRGRYLNNLVWTALCVGFIYLVFKLGFNVMI